MTPEQFCYWLQGFFEISSAERPDVRETMIIKDHLKTVFAKVTPERNVVGFGSIFTPDSRVISCSLGTTIRGFK